VPTTTTAPVYDDHHIDNRHDHVDDRHHHVDDVDDNDQHHDHDYHHESGVDDEQHDLHQHDLDPVDYHDHARLRPVDPHARLLQDTPRGRERHSLGSRTGERLWLVDHRRRGGRCAGSRSSSARMPG
jgi:hypothetical protein